MPRLEAAVQENVHPAMGTGGKEQLIGVVDAGLRLVMADLRLERLLEQGPLLGRRLLDVVPDSVRSFVKLASRRMTREVVLPLSVDGDAEVIARTAIVGDQTWLLLVERERSSPPRSERRRFVGRAAELLELDRHLADARPNVLYVQGPLGVGKSALLGAFVVRCQELGCPHFRIDARTSPPTQQAVLRVITQSVQRGPLERLDAARELGMYGWALVIDNFDAWQDVDPDDHGHPFASLPPSCRIIVAARRAPSPRSWWPATHPPHVITLGLLSEGESEELAVIHDVAPAHREDVLRRAGGHPLSIRSFATALREGKDLTDATLPHDIDLGAIGPREVLEVGAVPARITEDVLAALLDHTDAASAFDVLGALAIRAPNGIGLRMPVLVREALVRRLRERNPARLTELERRLTVHVAAQVERRESHLVPILDDFLDSLDDRLLVKRAAGSRLDRLPRTRRAEPRDRAALASALRRFESEDMVAAILARFDQGFALTVLVESEKGIEGACQYATLSAATAARVGELRDDSALAAATEVLRRNPATNLDEYVLAVLAWSTEPVRRGEWGTADQALYRYMFPLLATPPRARAVVHVLAEPSFPVPTNDAWGPEQITPVGAHHVLYRDLGGIPTHAFLTGLLVAEPVRAPMLLPYNLVTETPISTETVRQALLQMEDHERLTKSPLITLRVIDVIAGSSSELVERARALGSLLKEMVTALAADDRNGHRQRDVITAVFFERAGKHEKIAADLGVPYSTFRRWLSRGVERISELLLVREHAARRALSEHR
jgi:hypothetical protein